MSKAITDSAEIYETFRQDQKSDDDARRGFWIDHVSGPRWRVMRGDQVASRDFETLTEAVMAQTRIEELLA